MIKLKSIFKSLSLIILSFCAVCICAIFFNHVIDLKSIKHLISDEIMPGYNMLIEDSQLVVGISCAVLAVLTLIILLFSISKFIADCSAELGILKALGYSSNRLSIQFTKYGLGIFVGSLLGFFASFIFARPFYDVLDTVVELPAKVPIRFNIETLLVLVALPSALFSLFSMIYARLVLRKAPLSLIKGNQKNKVNKITKYLQNKNSNKPFLKELKRNSLMSNLLLIFFMGFAALAFAAEVQMAFMMRQIDDDLLIPGIMVFFGLLMGFTTLLLALSFVIKKNKNYLLILKGYGYTDKECSRALFGGYRIITYIGFLLGTIYQYFFMLAMDDALHFSMVGFFVAAAAFFISYELLIFWHKKKIAKLPLNKIA